MLHDDNLYRVLTRRARLLSVAIIAPPGLAAMPSYAGGYPGGPRPDYPRDELEFCPSGRPPGWMNYFDRKRDDKRRSNYWRYHGRPKPHAYYHPTGADWRQPVMHNNVPVFYYLPYH